MKSPTSLIRFRNAVGVVLALSAVFAVVISTISLPSDDASAQTTLTEDQMRAQRWWNELEPIERVNVLLGNEEDAVLDVEGEAATQGRQLMDAIEGNNLPIEIAQLDYMDDEQTNDTAIEGFVNGDGADDLYAVGSEIDGIPQNLRGFQSVELWWNYLTCAEARIATGEDNAALESAGAAADDPTSMFCDITRDAQGGNPVVSRKTYSAVSEDAVAKAQANEVGQAILGADIPETLTVPSHIQARAERWWGVLTAGQRAAALYGDGATGLDAPTDPGAGVDITVTRVYLASLPYSEITPNKMFTFDRGGVEVSVGLDDDSKALATEVKALIHDRTVLVYGTKGPYSGPYEGVVAWWSAIGCLEMEISVGEDNEPGTEGTGFCRPWFAAGGNLGLEPANEERALVVGRALLGLDSIPDAAGWWDTIGKYDYDGVNGRIAVVYGNPPVRTEHQVTGDHDNNPVTTDTDEPSTDLLPADMAVFQVAYAALDDTTEITNIPSGSRTDALLTREGVTGVQRNAQAIIDAIADELFDPPMQLPPTTTSDDTTTINDDTDFDPPYRSVGDWWQQTDCRVMRLAVGEDNDYTDPVATTDDPDTEVDETMLDAEKSGYCGMYPGAVDENDMAIPMAMWIGEDAQKRIDEVGIALLAREKIGRGRPSFNDPAEGTVSVTKGTAQVGATLEASDTITDDEGVGTKTYTWFHGDDADYSNPLGTGTTYEVKASDVNKTLRVRVTFNDLARYPEMVTSAETVTIAGSPGQISRIEPGIRGITVSGGDTVTLSVDIYGLQDAKDNSSLGGTFEWSVNGERDDDLGSDREADYTASSSPGKYLITASLGGGECQPAPGADRDDACSAEFDVTVRRPSADGPEQEAPANPPGTIPGILADSDGNQYEVFTPVEGGTFTGEGYSLTVDAGAVPNGEFLGIRMSDEGAASNVGMTHQRYTLGGNMYAISAVDSSQAAISSYVLDDPAMACVPLPDELRSNISDLALVAINSDGSLTILAAQVRIRSAGNIVCGALSNLPASVAVGSSGAPAAIPTPTPEPTAVPPPTGGTAPASSMVVLWSMLLGIAVFALGSVLVIARRREGARTR